MGFLPGWNEPSSMGRSLSGASDSMAVTGARYVPAHAVGAFDRLFDDIPLGPYVGRRFAVGIGRAGGYPCSAPAMAELHLSDEEVAALSEAFRTHPEVALVEADAVRFEQSASMAGEFDLTGLQWQLDAIR
ncbi:MAG: hypothetical protein U5Q16_05420 [Gammaproteobacteria bacterium]|nr:hypothetical protein [Gammaproteobacteria bacterium]